MKRFYDNAAPVETPDGFGVALDGRLIRTPAKRSVVLPNAAVAEALASEWAAQQEEIDLAAMGLNRLVNIAIDRVAQERDLIVQEAAAYGGSDLLCYRAEQPEELVNRQVDLWDPLLAWADERYGARLTPTAGILHVAQDEDALARLRDAVDQFDIFALSALHTAVGISGSLVIGLALAERVVGPEPAWRAAQVDEDWQIERWGEDAEAEARRANAYAVLCDADGLLGLIRD